jgi:cyclic beta-1,2-glucan synthetase
MVRSLVRRVFTGRRLLEWETAEEAEISTERRSPADSYLNWVPLIAVGLGTLVFFARHDAFFAALAILVLWACSKPFSVWLNNPSRPLRYEASENDELFLRRAALRTWRYFSEFCTAEHNWLIPDNIQEDPASIAPRLSPTNLGLLLNARQVACEFGYLTVPEFADLTSRTLATMEKLPRYRGQLLNWYDTRTLATLPPAFVSSVDSGNLIASLWTLEQGTLERLQRPLLQSVLAEGFFDHLRILVDLHEVPRKVLARFDREMHEEEWLNHLLDLRDNFLDETHTPSKAKPPKDVEWFAAEAVNRLRLIKQTVDSYCPWLQLEFAPLWNDPALKLEFASHSLSLDRLPQFIDKLAEHLEFVGCSTASESHKILCQRLRTLLPGARTKTLKLSDDLRGIAAEARRFANAMDFRFLLNRRRKMLSVGYDVDLQELHSACYDLLATESRTAVFAAIAKEDIPQESWFMLGRAHTMDKGRPVLLSWTGTMFEYLMPAIWMRTYPNTLLDRSRVAVVRSQQAFTAAKRIPWGISESAHFKTDQSGNYQYYAFGLPQLALRSGELNKLVISPYSTFLAMHVDAPASVSNLRRMTHDGWFGPYGFYESADYSASSKRSWRPRFELVRCWMAHHQGMILLSIANFLHDGVVQRWFHGDPRVQATELLLHEKPVAHVRVTATGNDVHED